MNGFEIHGIKHTSASQINLWSAEPALWMMEKLYGKKYRMSPAAKRGTVIEKAVVNVLAKGHNLDESIQFAIGEFDTFFSLSNDPKKDKERECIEPCILYAVECLKQFGEPEFMVDYNQQRIEILCRTDKWCLPVHGYLDLIYPKHKKIIDLKTTTRMPSEMSIAHQRQSSIYKTAYPDYDVEFLYVTPKKYDFKKCENHKELMAGMKSALIRQERFLSLSENKEELAMLLPLNDMDSFYWSDPQVVADAKQIFGIPA